MTDQTKTISDDAAMRAAQRFIDYAFGNEAERPRFSIPATHADDDLLLTGYLNQSRATRQRLEQVNAQLERTSNELAMLRAVMREKDAASRVDGTFCTVTRSTMHRRAQRAESETAAVRRELAVALARIDFLQGTGRAQAQDIARAENTLAKQRAEIERLEKRLDIAARTRGLMISVDDAKALLDETPWTMPEDVYPRVRAELKDFIIRCEKPVPPSFADVLGNFFSSMERAFYGDPNTRGARPVGVESWTWFAPLSGVRSHSLRPSSDDARAEAERAGFAPGTLIVVDTVTMIHAVDWFDVAELVEEANSLARESIGLEEAPGFEIRDGGREAFAAWVAEHVVVQDTRWSVDDSERRRLFKVLVDGTFEELVRVGKSSLDQTLAELTSTGVDVKITESRVEVPVEIRVEVQTESMDPLNEFVRDVNRPIRATIHRASGITTITPIMEPKPEEMHRATFEAELQHKIDVGLFPPQTGPLVATIIEQQDLPAQQTSFVHPGTRPSSVQPGEGGMISNMRAVHFWLDDAFAALGVSKVRLAEYHYFFGGETRAASCRVSTAGIGGTYRPIRDVVRDVLEAGLATALREFIGQPNTQHLRDCIRIRTSQYFAARDGLVTEMIGEAMPERAVEVHASGTDPSRVVVGPPRKTCDDGGSCHHRCIETCSRRNTGCVPLTYSGLGDDWQPPARPRQGQQKLPLPVIPTGGNPLGEAVLLGALDTEHRDRLALKIGAMVLESAGRLGLKEIDEAVSFLDPNGYADDELARETDGNDGFGVARLLGAIVDTIAEAVRG